MDPRVWTDAENLDPTGFDPRTVQPVGGCYTDYAIPAHDLVTVLTEVFYLQGSTNIFS